MTREIERQKERISQELEEHVEEAQEKAQQLGLEPRDVKYWINDNDEVNKLSSYGGFQKRYPHWRWGMKYDKQSKQSEYGGGKIFEMVINDDPCHAYLQMSNDLVDQKAVIAHVEAHSDFFGNNTWFQDDPNAVDMLSRHAEKIRSYMEDPDIAREEVEKWIDKVSTLEDNINQFQSFVHRHDSEEDGEDDEVDPLDSMGISEDVQSAVFPEDYKDKYNEENPEHYIHSRHHDVIEFLMENGSELDEETGQAVDLPEWKIDILDMLREEYYYFAPQKMTKIMNEGWASLWESIIMTREGLGNEEDFVDYADQHSKVLGSPGFNPYALGKALWKHIENTVNRREVVDKLLRIDGIDADNFHREIDFQQVHEELDERDSDDIVKRNYSLTRQGNQSFIQEISVSELRTIGRYIFENDRYDSVEQAISEVDYSKGWERMFEVRETHNDVMFLDEFLTQEFVDAEQYYTYEFRASHEEVQVSSKDVEDVKKKLLLQFTNFGKPTIDVATGNYENKRELLLVHNYNGVVMNMDNLEDMMKTIYDMWGRPVNIATMGKKVSETEMDHALSEGEEPDIEEIPVVIKYDGDRFTEEPVKDEEIEEFLEADEVDYDTKPEEWL